METKETEQPQPTKEEIYSCIKCHYPLSSSLSVKTTKDNYDVILENIKEDFHNSNSKCIFIVEKALINKLIGKKYCFEIDLEKEKIICKNDKEVVGFVKTINDEELFGTELVFGYLNIKKIEITEVGFKLKKEIPVYSQEQYTVLAKLKQLRYYVKQLTPTLKNSMELVKDERKNIFVCEDKFDKYKLNLIINKSKEIKQNINNDNNNDEDKKDKDE